MGYINKSGNLTVNGTEVGYIVIAKTNGNSVAITDSNFTSYNAYVTTAQKKTNLSGSYLYGVKLYSSYKYDSTQLTDYGVMSQSSSTTSNDPVTFTKNYDAYRISGQYLLFYSNFSYNSFCIDLSSIASHVVSNTPTTASITISGTLQNCTANVTSGQTVSINSQLTITLTANGGYEFYNDTYTFLLNNTTTNFTLSSDYKTLTWTGTVTGAIDLNGTYDTEQSQWYILISGTLINCTCNHSPNTLVDRDSTQTVTITPDTNYKFISADTFMMGSDSVYFTLTDAGALTWTGAVTANININKIYAPTQIISPTVSISVSAFFTNCAADFTDGQTYGKNTEQTLTVTADDGYVFNSTETYSFTIGNTLNQFTLSQDSRTLAWTGTVTDDIYVTVSITATRVESFTVHITGTITHATANITDGQTLTADTPHTITITADSGYYFPFYSGWIESTSGNYPYYMCTRYEDATLDNLETLRRSSDAFTISDTVTVSNNLWLFAEYNAVPYPSGEIGIYTHIFTLTRDNLFSLTRLIFTEVTNGTYPQIQSTFSEYDNFIIGLYKLPFSIPDEIKAETDYNVPLGAIQTTLKPTALQYYHFSISLGTIHVPKKYKNVYDYINTMCRLYLPFYGFMDIDVDYLIGKTLAIQYDINLFDGLATITIIDNATNNVIRIATKTVKYDIPFFKAQYEAINSNAFDAPIIESNLTAFLEIRRNQPLNHDGYYGKTTYGYKMVNTLGSGYHSVLDILLDSFIPDIMQTEIKSIMQGGFIL